ncbi:hypothetical protein [Streptomyces sp. NPDC004008]
MSGPSSTPRPEHTPRPGGTWERQLVSLGEIVVDTDRDENPFGWTDLPTTPPDDHNAPAPPRPNRETRRAAKRAARRKK